MLSNRWFKLFLKVCSIIAVIALVFIILNFDFFWKNIRYFFKHSPQEENYVEIVKPQPLPDMQSQQPSVIWIDSLGITAPLQYTDGTTEQDFQAALKEGVVHYPGTALPGEVGNAYYFGHSSDYPWSGGKYKTVFALLPQISTDAVIKISDKQGTVYSYKVILQKVIASNDVSVLSQETGGKKLLTLQTSYPVGTALKRYIVVAELINN